MTVAQSNFMVYNGLWANRPDASDIEDGRIGFMQDIGPNGSMWGVKDGEWQLAGGFTLLGIDSVPKGIAPSGTIGTGASDNIVLGTALPHTYASGIWLYLPAVAGTTPAITAGFKWIEFSAADTGTVYSDGPGSDPIDFTVGDTYAGVTTAVTLQAVLLQGGVMGDRGVLNTVISTSVANSADDKIISLKLGSTTFFSDTQLNVLQNNVLYKICNRGESLQFGNPTAYSASYGSTATAKDTGTEDTSVDLPVYIIGQLETATEYLILEDYRFELIRG